MNIKGLTLSAAVAALIATGALAQNTTTEPASPPAATAPAPAATAPAAKDSAASTTTTTTSTTTEALQFTSSVGATQMAVSKLTGTDVRNAAGENLGDINDVLVDESGKPTVAIIGVGGFLGIGEKNVGVPFEALKFTMSNDTKTRVARLDVTKDTLKAAPTFAYNDEAKANAEPAARTQ